MQLLISDANILIDMEEGELINQMFQLSYQFSIPDILFDEELEEEHSHLLDLGLHINELSGETMVYAMELIPRYSNASRNDCFALALARQENCPLLTGDRALRVAAETESVVVKGTLWLVNLLVRQGLINVQQARDSYKKMKDSGRRLPWHVAEAMLAEFEKNA